MKHAQSQGLPRCYRSQLIDAIQKSKKLTLGATSTGIRVHVLPDKPRDIADDGEFHYVVLGPKAVSDVGKPSIEAQHYIEETTGSTGLGFTRNSIIILTPAKEGIELARKCIIDYLGWKKVPSLLKEQNIDTIDPIRLETLKINTDKAQKSIPDAIQQAYCIVITVNEKDVITAFRLSITGEPHFELIKKDKNSRIEDSAINAEALLPEGPYNLWKEGETSRRVKDIIGSFAQFPRLPKMLQRKEIVATLIHGVKDGYFVLQTTRPNWINSNFLAGTTG